MHPIPQEIIDQIDDLLGLQGRPQINLANGQWVGTGAYEWSKYPSPGLLWMGMSPELRQAMADAYRKMALDHIELRTGSDFLEVLRQVDASVVEEFVAFQDGLQEAEKRITNPTGATLPGLSDELNAALSEIMQRAGDQFEGDEFDLDAFHERARLLMQDLPENLKTEFEVLRPQLEKLLAIPAQAEQERRSRLAKVRKALKGTSFLAYGDIVVAYTKNKFDLLRREHTSGANYGLSTRDLIKELGLLDKKYGLDIVDAGSDSVTFILERPPQGLEVDELGKYLLKLCPDLGELPVHFPREEIALWWD